MNADVLMVGVVAGFLALDNRAAGRFLVGEPLIVGGVVGACLGEVITGFSIGAWFQLLWIHLLPEGAVTPPDGTVPTAVAVALVTELSPRVAWPPHALIMLVMAVTVPLGFVSRWMEIHLKEGFGRLSHWSDAYAYYGQTTRIVRVVAFAISAEWLKTFSLTLLAIIVGGAVLPRMIVSLPRPICEGLALAYWFILPLGLAVVVDLMRVRNKIPVFLSVFMSISLMAYVFHVAQLWLWVMALVGGVGYGVGWRKPRGLWV